MSTCLIDADILVYRAGFSSQKTYYCVEDAGTGLVHELPSIKDAIKFETDITVRIDKMPEEYAANRLTEIIQSIQKGTGCRDYKMYLTGKNNFRDTMDTLYPYKGNRKAAKPLHYSFIRSLIIEEYGAEVANGQEADDALGIAQTKDTIIATIDKDLLMIPGRHYNINTGKKIMAKDPGELTLSPTNKLTGMGFKWFCAQMLMGDVVDNIKGVPLIGNVKAYRILKDINDQLSMWQEVEKVYYKNYPMAPRLEENALLLWIRREEEQHPFTYIGELR